MSVQNDTKPPVPVSPDTHDTPAQQTSVNIVGAGLAGLSAAITLAEAGVKSRLISRAPSERAQSVLAEGGINAVLDHYGEADTIEDHLADTVKGGVFLADRKAVSGLVSEAPDIIAYLSSLGVPFNVKEDGRIAQRYFGGQKKRRTAYVGSFTGKMLMSALIDEARKYEVAGLIERFDHHVFVRLMTSGDRVCTGLRVQDLQTGNAGSFDGPVLLASGGLNGMFPGKTTGTAYNTGDVTACVFAQGVALSDPEMIQYHPTTIAIPGKRMLITEAARGEGGRLYIHTAGAARERYYFMEDRYPELGNLMPRDVVSREIHKVLHDHAFEDQVYLDMTTLPEDVWNHRLNELREEIIHYLAIDPKTAPVPVSPGIHYFMGGIDVDRFHRTNLRNLYAAGECCSLYHGANRLGGNSTMGAIYGGRVAARTLIHDMPEYVQMPASAENTRQDDAVFTEASPAFCERVGDILFEGLGIVRDEAGLRAALGQIQSIKAENACEQNRLLLAQAMLEGALLRKESRGAHFRSDFPETGDRPYIVRMLYCEDGLQGQILDVDAV